MRLFEWDRFEEISIHLGIADCRRVDGGGPQPHALPGTPCGATNDMPKQRAAAWLFARPVSHWRAQGAAHGIGSPRERHEYEYGHPA